MPLLAPAYAPLTGDTHLSDRPAWLYGLVVLASAGGGAVTLYDGNDASSGQKVGRFEGANNISNPILFPHPVPLHRGLFVDVGSNITEVLVLWRPMTTEEAQELR